jgi:hypothetical protein
MKPHYATKSVLDFETTVVKDTILNNFIIVRNVFWPQYLYDKTR